jgi:hypothetical protein
MDGNFSAEHMRHRSGERDVPLSAGMAFTADPESYKAHLRSGQEIVQVCMNPLIRYSWLRLLYSLVHVIPTKLLNKLIPVGRILMSQALVQLPAATDFLF